MLHSFRIAERQPVEVMPFFDLVLVADRGVSYGWFTGIRHLVDSAWWHCRLLRHLRCGYGSPAPSGR